MNQNSADLGRFFELSSFVGLKRSQIDYYLKQGDFPRPVQLGARAVGWFASEIAAWQRSRKRVEGGENAPKPVKERMKAKAEGGAEQPKRGPGRPRRVLAEG